MNSSKMQKIIKALKAYAKFLITAHIDLEGDALGSELAMASLLKKMGKLVYIVNSDCTPLNYNFLPGVNKIYSIKDELKGKENSKTVDLVKKLDFEAAIIIDCADQYRAGNIFRLVTAKEIPIINIDHHIGNNNFGAINWIEPRASSAGEMIYRLFEFSRTKLDKSDALNIYTAILTDTGSFRHANTTTSALYIASKLLQYGIKPEKLYAQIYENNSLADIALLAKIYPQISFCCAGRVAHLVVSRRTFDKLAHRPEILDRAFDFAKSVDTIKIVIVFSQIGKRMVKISFRSKSPVNVQTVARAFGGGGHKFASGCILNRSLQQAKQLVLRQVKKSL